MFENFLFLFRNEQNITIINNLLKFLSIISRDESVSLVLIKEEKFLKELMELTERESEGEDFLVNIYLLLGNISYTLMGRYPELIHQKDIFILILNGTLYENKKLFSFLLKFIIMFLERFS